MTTTPNDMDANPRSDEPDDLKSIDQALLVALTGRERSREPLTASQEELLDGWVLGNLSAADAEAAARLVRHNSFAAERVMERRLVAAAATGPAIPPAVSARILKAAQPRPVEARKVLAFRWPLLSSLQWSAAGAAVAAALVAGAFGIFAWHENTRSYQRVQLAMVTIDDRRALSGAPQYRTLRSDGTAPAAADGFRDVDIPADLLRRAIASTTSADQAPLASQLRVYLPPQAKSADFSKIVIDSAIADRLSGEWSGRTIVPVRVYSLDEPRMRPIRESLSTQVGAEPLMLLTVRR